MPKQRGKIKAKPMWLDQKVAPDKDIAVKEFMKLINDDEYSIYCELCDKSFYCGNMGHSSIPQHLKGIKHQEKFNDRYENTQQPHIEDLVRPHDDEENPDLNARQPVDDIADPQPSTSSGSRFGCKAPTTSRKKMASHFLDDDSDDVDDPDPVPDPVPVPDAEVTVKVVEGGSSSTAAAKKKDDFNNNPEGIHLLFFYKHHSSGVEVRRMLKNFRVEDRKDAYFIT